VYIYRNKINYKIYVGKTGNLSQRMTDHKKMRGDCPKFHNAIKKYGIDTFDIFILCKFDKENECLNAEKYYINYFKSNINKFGYNLTNGGDGVSGYKHTKESKQKMSLALKGRTSPMKGKHHSKETIIKLSNSHKGKKGYWKDKKLSYNHKKKLSNSHKGYIMPDKQKKIISITNTGKKCNWIKRGVNNYNSKLNLEDVSKIRELYKTNNYTYKDIAYLYNIGPTTVYRIIKNINYINNDYFESKEHSQHLKSQKKLNINQVIEIKKLLLDGFKNIEIAKKYNVDSSLISAIKIGRIWKHIKG